MHPLDKPSDYRTVQPKRSSFCSAEIRALFARGLLTVAENVVVVDCGFLNNGAPDDEWDPHTCPSCGLVWGEVLFAIADYLCRCGHAFLGVLENPEDSAVWEELWGAAIDLYEQSMDEDAASAAAFALEARMRSARAIPDELALHFAAYGFKFVVSVCGTGASNRLPVDTATAVWLPIGSCVFQSAEFDAALDEAVAKLRGAPV